MENESIKASYNEKQRVELEEIDYNDKIPYRVNMELKYNPNPWWLQITRDQDDQLVAIAQGQRKTATATVYLK